MNASATVFSVDIVKKYIQPKLSEKGYMRSLYLSTMVFGIIGLLTGLAMIGSKSILDKWWELSGIFAGGMLGLFLLGMVSRSAKRTEALLAVIIGVLVIMWMTFSTMLPGKYAFLRSPLHKNMVIVVGTLVIFLVGLLLTNFKKKHSQGSLA
jgi:SSS family solute:Na+ symporter